MIIEKTSSQQNKQIQATIFNASVAYFNNSLTEDSFLFIYFLIFYIFENVKKT